MPLPFRFPAADDVFKQIRAERKWFKNVRLFPSELPGLPLEIDEFGKLQKYADTNSEPVQIAERRILEHPVTHPSPYRANDHLPPCPRINVSQEVATRAITAIAADCGATVGELREMCRHGSDLIDSLGLDSLMSLENRQHCDESRYRNPEVRQGLFH